MDLEETVTRNDCAGEAKVKVNVLAKASTNLTTDRSSSAAVPMDNQDFTIIQSFRR
jgi:hypothetical protein